MNNKTTCICNISDGDQYYGEKQKTPQKPRVRLYIESAKVEGKVLAIYFVRCSGKGLLIRLYLNGFFERVIEGVRL